jgi:AraC family transcriptional regulator of adaptative response/methylated-DNA-[protein]-cysteine methyltransferase
MSMTADPLDSIPAVPEIAGLSPAAAWAAVLARDRALDGRFVYAVRTTGVFCRPGCRSRQPRRENVEFFATPREALAAGYRACRRCGAEPAAAPPLQRLERARALLDAQLDSPPSLDALAERVGLSAGHLQRTFATAFGVSPKQYVLERRAARFKSSLRRSGRITDAQYDAGYSASSRAQAGANAHLGMAPRDYRSGGHGVGIRYALRRTDLGTLLVASTERGVCAVQLGDSAQALESALAHEFPAAHRRRVTGAGDESDRQFVEWIDAIVGHLSGGQRKLSVPVDVAATAFQRRVWRELQRIPYGETRTYAGVAKAIGRPGAARAVARACATNPVAIVVPCHRVVPASQAPGGYRWGAARKKRLLENESDAPTR